MISISIIIPVYNVEAYVKRCIESVMMQDQVAAKVECIIVDDCGQDHSMQIVYQMLQCYHGPIRFEVIKHDVNRGLSVARNTGIQKAKGDYVFFMDSDDYLLPDSISYFLDNLKEYPDADIVIGNAKNCKTGDKLLHHINVPRMINDSDIFFQSMLRHQIYLYAWNKLIRRSVLRDKGIAFIDRVLYEDQSWSYLLFLNISSVLLLPRVTYIYEYNMSSIVNTTFTLSKVEIVIWSYVTNVSTMLKNPPPVEKFRKNMAVDYLMFMHYFLMNAVDVKSCFRISTKTAKAFRNVRWELIRRSLSYGRFFLATFFLILFPPLSYLQKYSLFRHHYSHIEIVINRLCHLTDFIHNKVTMFAVGNTNEPIGDSP